MNILQEHIDNQFVKEPVPVSIIGTTFGNELQTKIYNQLIVNNWLLTYLCVFITARHFLNGN